MSDNTLLLTIVCPDRPGLISAVAAELFDLGVNLGDTNFAVLGEGAEFSMVLHSPQSLPAGQIEQALRALPGLEQAELRLSPFRYGTLRGETGTVTHHVTLEGDDQPGLVARLTELFMDYGANVVRMDTRTLRKSDGPDYVIELWVWIPPERAESCLGALNNTAAALGMGCSAERL